MSDYSELKRLAEALLASDDHADFPGWMAASDAFDNATGPAAVLALIADLDEARNGMKHSCAIRLKKQIEKLKAEVDRLRKDDPRFIALMAQGEQP